MQVVDTYIRHVDSSRCSQLESDIRTVLMHALDDRTHEFGSFRQIGAEPPCGFMVLDAYPEKRADGAFGEYQ